MAVGFKNGDAVVTADALVNSNRNGANAGYEEAHQVGMIHYNINWFGIKPKYATSIGVGIGNGDHPGQPTATHSTCSLAKDITACELSSLLRYRLLAP